MIEELRVLQEIVGDMTGMGLWLAGGFLVIKLAEVGAFVGAFCFFVKLVAGVINSHFTAKSDLSEAHIKINEINSKNEISKRDHLSEINAIKAAYKIMKEAKSE